MIQSKIGNPKSKIGGEGRGVENPLLPRNCDGHESRVKATGFRYSLLVDSLIARPA
jgi:hypothetical protein